MLDTPVAPVVIVYSVNVSKPLFSHHETVSSSNIDDIISISPSLSISIAIISDTPIELLVITCSVKLSEPLFSHQETVLSI